MVRGCPPPLCFILSVDPPGGGGGNKEYTTPPKITREQQHLRHLAMLPHLILLQGWAADLNAMTAFDGKRYPVLNTHRQLEHSFVDSFKVFKQLQWIRNSLVQNEVA
jgi:hypothetical protein